MTQFNANCVHAAAAAVAVNKEVADVVFTDTETSG